MAQVNTKRVLIGALAGGVVWNLWSTLVNMVFLESRYQFEQTAGTFLKQPRQFGFPAFMTIWIVMIFVLSFIVVSIYASGRATRGAGLGPALVTGAMVGIVAAFPVNFSVAMWGTIGRGIPLFWALDMFVGCILAAVVGGWLYKD